MPNIQVDDGRFKRREWWLLIALLLGLEYWLFSISHALSGEQALVNYVSFASGIASILLAIVAIIYSFVQGDSQRRVEGALASQVAHLQEASKQLSNSKNQLEIQLDRVDTFTQKIDGLHELVGGSFNNIEGSLSNLRKEIAANVKPVPTSAPTVMPDKKAMAAIVLAQSTFDADLLTFALYKYVSIDKEDKNVFPFLGDHFARPLGDAYPNVGYAGYLNIGWQVLATLQAIGLLSTKDKLLTITDELKQYLAIRGPEVQGSTAEKIAKNLPAITATFAD